MARAFLAFTALLAAALLSLPGHALALTPREAAMEVAIGGWGDGGQATIVDHPTNGGPYSLRVHWKDNPATDLAFWHLGWAAPAKGYDTLGFDIMVQADNGKAGLTVYLTEADGDRWVADFGLKALADGKWHHLEFPRDKLRLWPLGNGKKDWDSISEIDLEPNGKGGEITFYLDNVYMSGPAAAGGARRRKNLLDPANLPKPYEIPAGKTYPLDTFGPAGMAYIAGGANYWCLPPGAPSVEGFCALSPSVAISAGGYPSLDLMGKLSGRLAALGRGLMNETAVGVPFAVEITEAGAWGVRWDGASNNVTPNRFSRMHAVSLCNPTILALQKRRINAMLAAGINTLTFVDYVWPYWGGRWGYAPADIAAYRRALAGTDGGLKTIEGGKVRTVSFWDYYRDYSGFVLKPADLGLKTWADFTPTTEAQAWADHGAKRRNMHVFVTLCHYEWLRFLQQVGLYLKARGGHLWIIPNPEDLGNASDYVYAGKLDGLQGNLPEYFGNPMWTDALYRSGGYLAKTYHDAGHFLGPQLETNAGGHGTPYYDPQVSYAATYDLCAALRADVIKNDFLDEAPFSVMTDPKQVQFDRFRDCMAKVYAFDQYRADRPARPVSDVAVVTLRNINRYRGSIFYGFGATPGSDDGCLADALAHNACLFDYMDTISAAPIESHRVIFWGVAEAPRTAVERVRRWLAADPRHVLVCHSYQPTRRMSGLNYCPLIAPQDFVEHPDGGAPWGLPRIMKHADVTSATVDRVEPPFTGVFHVGDKLELPGGYYSAPGGKVLLDASGRPLVSEFRGPGDSRVIYIHYRAGEPDTLALDRRVLAALGPWLGVKTVADSAADVLVHSYALAAGGSVDVLWARKPVEGWHFVYDGNRKQRLLYRQPGVDASVRVLVPKPGRYVVYDALTGGRHAAAITGEHLSLSLHGVVCAVRYILPEGPAATACAAKLQAAPIRHLLAEH